MGEHKNTIQLVATLVAVFLGAEASGTQLASKEVPFTLLFKSYPAKIGRGLSSSRKRILPTVTFNRTIAFSSSGEARIGKTCSIRNVTLSQASGHNYYNSALAQSQGGSVKAGSTFEMGLISFQFESLQLELSSKSARGMKLELGCAHPSIQNWSVSDFEAYSSHQLTVRVPASLAAERVLHSAKSGTLALIQDLKGFRFNGVFGSGLPGTSGIQLLIGANLKAYSAETSIPLLIGRRCQMVSQSSASFNDRYLKGAKFAFRGYRSNPEAGTVELVFDNLNHSPHELKVECIGQEAEVKQMSLQEVERDLNGAIRFYRK